VVILYAFHDYVHEHLFLSDSDNGKENNDSCDIHCPIIKAIHEIKEYNSPTDLKETLEFLSLHVISNFSFLIPDDESLFRNIQYTYLLTLHLSKPTPPPEYIS